MRCKNFLVAVLLLPIVTSHRDFMKSSKIEVALEIFKELNVGYCIIVVESIQSTIDNHKEVYNYNKFIAHIQKEDLELLLRSNESLYMRIGIVINIEAISVLKDHFENNPFKVAQYTWLIFANEDVGYKLNIPYNCEFLLVESIKENEYVIKEIYHVKYTGPFVVDFGVWSNAFRLIVNNKFNDERKNMRGATLVRGDNHGLVNVSYGIEVVAHFEQTQKICNDFIIEIKHREMWVEYSRLLNYSLVVVNDHLDSVSTGPMAPDGSPCCIAQHSLYYIPDTVFPTCLMPTSMVIKFENDLGEGWKAYFKPFEGDLWLSVFGFLMVSVTTLMIIGYFTNKTFYINPFAAFYSFCCQDGIDSNNERFTNLSSSIAYLMPFIAATVIVPAYQAAILAKLTVQLPRVPFTDLETFVLDGTYKLGALNHTFSLEYFSKSKDPLVSMIYKKMFINKKEYPNLLDEAMNKLCKEKNFAFLSYGGSQFLEMISHCKLFNIQNFVLNLYCGFRMRFASPFRNIFSKLLIMFYTSGLIERIEGFYVMKKMKDDEDEFEPIELSQVLPIIYLIPLGIFLSLISLAIEIYVRKKKRKIKANVNQRKVSRIFDRRESDLRSDSSKIEIYYF